MNNSLHQLQFLTVKEAARKLRLTPATIRSHIRMGLLEAIKTGRAYLITEEALHRFLANQAGR